MTQWQTQNSEVSLLVNFIDASGELHLNTTPTITYTVFDGTGTEVSGFIAKTAAVPVDQDRVYLSIPAPANQVPVDTILDNRSVEVSWDSADGVKKTSLSYTLAAKKYLMVDTTAVRSRLHVTPEELPDASIPVVEIAIRLEELYPDLAAGFFNPTTAKMLIAREFMYLKIAIECIPSLRIGLMAGEKTDRHDYTRQLIDWDAVKQQLISQADTALAAARGSASATPVIFMMTQPTDKFTG